MKSWKQITFLLLLPALLAFTACPGDESANSDVDSDVIDSPPASAITSDSALEDADRILKEIDSL